MRNALVVLALAVAAGCSSPPPKRGEGSFTFEGRVVSDLDETVTLRLDTVLPWMHGGEKSMPQQHLETTAAPDGTFRFEGVHAHSFALTATSPSSAAPYGEHFHVTGDVRDVVIRVRPACRIVGHATLGPGIDPHDCWIEWTQGNATTSLDRGCPAGGVFEIPRLVPGPATVAIRHWPDRDEKGRAHLRVESRQELTLVPGDNAVELKIDADSPPAK
jgi:hypothetical protein